MSRLEFARAIGYTGTDRNDVMRVRRYENNAQQVPLYIARLVWLLAAWVHRTGESPPFPGWVGYDFDHTPDVARIDLVDDGIAS